MAKYTISVEAESYEELCARIGQLHSALFGTAATTPVDTVPSVVQDIDPVKQSDPLAGTNKDDSAAFDIDAKPAVEEEKPAKRRKRKAAEKALTADDIRGALTRVQQELGMPACKKILAQFNANRVSALDPENYKDFVAACDKAIEEAALS